MQEISVIAMVSVVKSYVFPIHLLEDADLGKGVMGTLCICWFQGGGRCGVHGRFLRHSSTQHHCHSNPIERRVGQDTPQRSPHTRQHTALSHSKTAGWVNQDAQVVSDKYNTPPILWNYLISWAWNFVVWIWWACSWTVEFVNFKLNIKLLK